MTTYYIACRVYRQDGHYWTIGISYEADDLKTAVKMFHNWQNGCYLHPNAKTIMFEGLSINIDATKYHKVTESIWREELKDFLAGTDTTRDESIEAKSKTNYGAINLMELYEILDMLKNTHHHNMGEMIYLDQNGIFTKSVYIWCREIRDEPTKATKTNQPPRPVR